MLNIMIPFLVLNVMVGLSFQKEVECDWLTDQEYLRADPGDCTKFSQCAPSGPVTLTCPAGTYWSQKNKICDTDASVCSGVCPNGPGGGYYENNGNCFYFSLEGGSAPSNWSEARNSCKELGLKFSTIADLAEMGGSTKVSDEWLMETITRQGSRVWLGANNPSKPAKGTPYAGWVWTHTGRELPEVFPLWGPNEPNIGVWKEWCVEIRHYEKGAFRGMYLNDNRCKNQKHHVCQFF